MDILVVRHAKAGDRDDWEGPDDVRPLIAEGRVQAERLVNALSGFSVGRILSSPYLRCTQTVEPLAAAAGLELEPCDALAEGAGRAAAELVTALAGDTAGHDGVVLCTHGDVVLCTHGDVVLCTHGDVVLDVLDALAAGGVALPDDVRLKKGSTWVLRAEGGRVVGARYLGPPAS